MVPLVCLKGGPAHTSPSDVFPTRVQEFLGIYLLPCAKKVLQQTITAPNFAMSLLVFSGYQESRANTFALPMPSPPSRGAKASRPSPFGSLSPVILSVAAS